MTRYDKNFDQFIFLDAIFEAGRSFWNLFSYPIGRPEIRPTGRAGRKQSFLGLYMKLDSVQQRQKYSLWMDTTAKWTPRVACHDRIKKWTYSEVNKNETKIFHITKIRQYNIEIAAELLSYFEGFRLFRNSCRCRRLKCQIHNTLLLIFQTLFVSIELKIC